jgi:hypothetical protein
LATPHPFFELRAEVARGAPKNVHLQAPLVVPLEIIAQRGAAAARELYGDVNLATARLQGAHQAPEDHAEVQIVQPISHEEQGGRLDCPADRERQDRPERRSRLCAGEILRDAYQEIEIVVLGRDDGERLIGVAVEVKDHRRRRCRRVADIEGGCRLVPQILCPACQLAFDVGVGAEPLSKGTDHEVVVVRGQVDREPERSERLVGVGGLIRGCRGGLDDVRDLQLRHRRVVSRDRDELRDAGEIGTIGQRARAACRALFVGQQARREVAAKGQRRMRGAGADEGRTQAASDFRDQRVPVVLGDLCHQ